MESGMGLDCKHHMKEISEETLLEKGQSCKKKKKIGGKGNTLSQYVLLGRCLPTLSQNTSCPYLEILGPMGRCRLTTRVEIEELLKSYISA